MAKQSIPFYTAEAEAGLAEAVASGGSLAYATKVLSTPKGLRDYLVTEQCRALAQQAIGSNVTFDLFPVSTILVTTGWNNNDDVFIKGETWAAKSTPEDKPFNLAHKPRQIIGHITDNVVVDDDYKVVEADTALDNVPDKFHILTSAVIYRHISSRDDTLEAEAAELIESIENGDWFVSMECLFADFDYGVTYASGEQQLIARSDNTAFLTKHLRIYGGCGEYNGGHLGRVLKNITFSGKGLVENPANPESVIFNNPKSFVGVFADTMTTIAAEHENIGDDNMADSNDKVVAQLEQQVASLQTDLSKAEAKVIELGEAQVQATLAEKNEEITSLTSQVATLTTSNEELTSSIETAKTAQTEAEEKATKAQEELTEAQTKLGEIAAKALTVARVAILVDKGVDKAEAEAVVADFADLDDEKFAKLADIHAKASASTTTETNEETETTETSTAGEGGEETEDKIGEAAAAAADLESATPDADANLSAGDENEADEVTQGIAAYLDQAMHN